MTTTRRTTTTMTVATMLVRVLGDLNGMNVVWPEVAKVLVEINDVGARFDITWAYHF